jgi:hypothetical protein
VSLYANLRRISSKLILQFGQVCTITRTAPGTGTVSTLFATVVRDSRVRHVADFSGGVEVGDWKLLVAADMQLLPGDRITIDTETLVVVRPAEPIKPGAVVVAWLVWGRNA